MIKMLYQQYDNELPFDLYPGRKTITGFKGSCTD